VDEASACKSSLDTNFKNVLNEKEDIGLSP
jgi:hypothetical protein